MIYILTVLLLAIAFCCGTLFGGYKAYCILGDELEHVNRNSDKHFRMFKLMNCWLELEQEGRSLSEYLISLGYNSIAIYGSHYIGERLYEDLKNSKLRICYAIDKSGKQLADTLKTVKPTETLEPVDLILVTAITYIEEIEYDLRERITCPVVSLENVFLEMKLSDREKEER